MSFIPADYTRYVFVIMESDDMDDTRLATCQDVDEIMGCPLRVLLIFAVYVSLCQSYLHTLLYLLSQVDWHTK